MNTHGLRVANLRSIKGLFFVFLICMDLPICSVWAQSDQRLPTTNSQALEQAKEDYPIWTKQAAALAMLLAIIFVVSVFLRGARGGWEKGKQQAETKRILKDFRRN